MEKTVMVKTENLCHTYEDGTQALKGIDLEIHRGEKIAIMGANGSGKSTFFLHLNGILEPTSGAVFIDGEPVDYSRKGLLKVRKKVGIVFQNPEDQLFAAGVKQEISFGVLNLGASQKQAEQAVRDVMEELHITEFSEKPTHFLSGGQKKRVTIADVLVMEPEVVLLDEPAAALDPKHARMMDTIVEQLSGKGITVLLSTHDVERALIWADRIILFDDGKIAGQGTPEEIFSQKDLLQQTNLECPAVLKIFWKLQEMHMLPEGLKTPHTVDELIESIQQINIPGREACSRKGAEK